MASLREDIGKLHATLARLFEHEGRSEDATLLLDGVPRLEETNYDNWNGGIYTFMLTLELPPKLFASLDNKVSEKEKFLKERFAQLTRTYSNEILGGVILVPSLDLEKGKPVGHVISGQPKFWTDGYFRLFISHVSAIKERASHIQQALAKYGISGFVAHDDIEPTKEWLEEIDLALNTMDSLLALLSKEFKESNWTSQEVGIGIGRGALIIPVRLGIDPYGFIGRYQGYQGMNKTPEEIAEAVFSTIAKHPQTSSKMATYLVGLFEKVMSWEDARRYWPLIEKCHGLDSNLAGRLLRAVETNEKVREAWGVPEKIAKLATRHGVNV